MAFQYKENIHLFTRSSCLIWSHFNNSVTGCTERCSRVRRGEIECFYTAPTSWRTHRTPQESPSNITLTLDSLVNHYSQLVSQASRRLARLAHREDPSVNKKENRVKCGRIVYARKKVRRPLCTQEFGGRPCRLFGGRQHIETLVSRILSRNSPNWEFPQ